MKNVFLFGLILTFLISRSQTPPIYKYFGDRNEYPTVLPTNDNCALLIGGFDYADTSFSYRPNSIIKIDSAGNLVFKKNQALFSPGTPTAFSDYYDATRCEGNNFAVVGSSGSYFYSSPLTRTGDLFYAKFDGLANCLYSKTLSDPGFANFVSRSISFCRDSGLVICGTATDTGSSHTRAFISKFSKSGNLDWMKSINVSPISCAGTSVKQTSDSGYIMIGSLTGSPFGAVLWKFDKTGNLTWCSRYCSQNGCPAGFDVFEFNSQYLCLARGSGMPLDYLFKCDLNGNVIWSREFISGGTKLKHVKNDKFLISDYGSVAQLIDTSGKSIWLRLTTLYSNVSVLKNKNFLVTVDCIYGKGKNPINNAVIILDSNATNSGTCIINNTVSTSTSVISASIQTCTVKPGGAVSSKQPTVTPTTLQINNGCYKGNPVGIHNQNSDLNVVVSPNPAQNSFEIVANGEGRFVKIELRNLFGHLVLSRELESSPIAPIDISLIPDGTYIYRIYTDGQHWKAGKLIVLH